MQNNTYPEKRWFFVIDVCSTHRTRELPIRLVMNVIDDWSNPVRMGVQNVNQVFGKFHLSNQNCKQTCETG